MLKQAIRTLVFLANLTVLTLILLVCVGSHVVR